MANLNFDKAFTFTVGNEGGYTNIAADRGGPTNWGITQHDLSVEYGRPASALEVKNMPIDTAKKIYAKRYWDSLGLDRIHSPGVAICLFDIGVIRGIGVPPIYAQQVCNDNHYKGFLAVDGHLGSLSIDAINNLPESIFINGFADKVRLGFLGIVARRPSQVIFIKGWLNRAKRLRTLIGYR